MKKGKVERLLDGSLESWYWLGYILADGGFSDNRVKLALGSEDQIQVRRFVEYLGKEYSGEYSGSFMCSKTVPIIKDKLFLTDAPKTYYPPSLELLESLDEGEFLSLFVGFSDGDGSIQYQTGRSTTKLTIKLHSSWLQFLRSMISRIYNILGYKQNTVAKIDGAGYSYVCIGNFPLQKDLKKFCLNKKLPILERKWSRIDLSLETKEERIERLSIDAKELLINGKTITEIANLLKINYRTAYHAVRRC